MRMTERAQTPSLLVLCPSHRRPQQAGELLKTFEATTTNASLMFVVSPFDPTSKDYPVVHRREFPASAMVDRSNMIAAHYWDRFDYIGWVADDNRFETPGWDQIVVNALQKTPVVFCNDVVSPGSKPSHVFMDTRIPKALGWFLHPDMRSTFFDDVWHDLGKGLGITYLDDVRVRHLYHEKDNREDFFHDMEVYQTWQRHHMEEDIAKCRRAMRNTSTPSRASR